jgi:hypothetical protein
MAAEFVPLRSQMTNKFTAPQHLRGVAAMQCQSCKKTVSQNDQFCRFCGERVVAPPPEPRARPSPGQIRIPIEDNDFGPSQVLAPHSSATGAGWGAHIYTGTSQGKGDVKERPENCPEWVESADWHRWFRRGLVVWESASKAVGTLLAGEAIELLGKLRADTTWKKAGIPIIERHDNVLLLDVPARRKRGGKKKQPDPETPPEPTPTKPKFYEKEHLRLTGPAAREFLKYLKANEGQLQQMAEEERRLKERFSELAFAMMVKIVRRNDLREFDPKPWKFAWVVQAEQGKLVADVPPDRITISLSEDAFWWQPVIERPGVRKWGYWERYIKLEDAIQWAETELPRLHAEDKAFDRKWAKKQAVEQARLAALPTKDLKPYRIKPSSLEPKQISYQSVIDVEYVSYRSKTEELSFGGARHYDEVYYTPGQLSTELHLPPEQVTVDQPSELLSLYKLRSRMIYHDATVAAAQAQALWDRSAIEARYAEKKLIRARYGYREVETGYCAWLGQMEESENGGYWLPPKTRAAYMAERAKNETLLRALDVNGYRKHHEIGFDLLSDDELLERMHTKRAQSKYQSAAVKAESEQWLQRKHMPRKKRQR